MNCKFCNQPCKEATRHSERMGSHTLSVDSSGCGTPDTWDCLSCKYSPHFHTRKYSTLIGQDPWIDVIENSIRFTVHHNNKVYIVETREFDVSIDIAATTIHDDTDYKWQEILASKERIHFTPDNLLNKLLTILTFL